jgi:RNA polymerase sigma-70 factor (ECF subfamily)
METAIDSIPERDAAEMALARARRGDPDAFETLYREHRGRVYGLALRMTREAGAAEELTQDAFVRAWRALPRFRGESRFGTWMHAITVRTYLQSKRSMDRRSEREVEDEDMDRYAFAARRAMPGTDIDVERAVARLPDGAREVLVLYDVYGYRHREIGEMLGIAEGTSKAQLHRARTLAREFLAR